MEVFRIYADVVFNHMTARNGIGTAGSIANYHNQTFPSVPFHENDFHSPCIINNYQDPVNVRNCRLKSLLDLDQSIDNVREKIVEYLNYLISLGIAGFRIDAAKHMWPQDLEYIYLKLRNLNVKFGFASGSRPFIFQEVIDYGNFLQSLEYCQMIFVSGGEAVSKHEYTHLGSVVEFKFSYSLNNMFRGNDRLAALVNWGPEWELVQSQNAVGFIDNHDNQRADDGVTLTYKHAKRYKMAIAFMLGHPYGTTRIISRPPADADGNLISPGIKDDGTCSNGYVCEHRWRQIFNMVGFRNVVRDAAITNWWSDGNQQIAFCRGDKGFILFTNYGDVDRTFQTCLTSGIYCDIISGELKNGRCTGKSVCVGEGGLARVSLGALEEDGVLAIH
ncbi:Alpha-amylase domain containing protein, partial [Asbolus verrucosus]